ncbi:MAG TPA: TIGR02147 family protein [Pyrinomonadaceae bacterium]|nr:TIGR02147 family protein [Pyrinomonadaceae bacterium]
MKRTQTQGRQSQPGADDFRIFLRERFQAALRRNPRFSLRSFARQLGVNHSTVSQILRNKRPVSARAVEEMGKRLRLSENLIARYKHGIKKRNKSTGRTLQEVRSFQFDLDTFELLSSWYHQAILELTHTGNFKPDSRWIGKRLGISVTEVNVAVQRLLRLGLLEMSSTSKWTDKSGDAEFQTAELTDAGAKRLSREVHELAADSLSQTAARYAHARLVVAIESSKLPELQRAAEEFMNEIRSLTDQDKNKDEVYQVIVSLFPLTKPN